MNKKLIVGGIIAGLIVILGIIYFSMKVSIQNKNEDLKARISAQQTSNTANFDKMFKVISQLAEVADTKMEKSKNAFKEIYPALMEGRYSKGDGSLMKWVTESNPQFDINAAANLYDKLAVAIEANREEFFIEQQKLIDYTREQHALLKKFPGSWFLNANDTIHIVVITSAKTKETFKTGEENDISIYKKDTTKK